MGSKTEKPSAKSSVENLSNQFSTLDQFIERLALDPLDPLMQEYMKLSEQARQAEERWQMMQTDDLQDGVKLTEAIFSQLQNLYAKAVDVRAKIYEKVLEKNLGGTFSLTSRLSSLRAGATPLVQQALKGLDDIVKDLETPFTTVAHARGDGTQTSFFVKSGDLIGVNFDKIDDTKVYLAGLRTKTADSIPGLGGLIGSIENQLNLIAQTDPTGPERRQYAQLRATIAANKGSSDMTGVRLAGSIVAGMLVTLGVGVAAKNAWDGKGFSLDLPTFGWAGVLALCINGGLPKGGPEIAQEQIGDIAAADPTAVLRASAITSGADALIVFNAFQAVAKDAAFQKAIEQPDVTIADIGVYVKGDAMKILTDANIPKEHFAGVVRFFGKDYPPRSQAFARSIMERVG